MKNFSGMNNYSNTYGTSSRNLEKNYDINIRSGQIGTRLCPLASGQGVRLCYYYKVWTSILSLGLNSQIKPVLVNEPYDFSVDSDNLYF
jgi:hypothetical protein